MKKKVTINIEDELVEEIREIAEKEDRTISGQIARILKEYLKKSTEK